jgi:outer membrane protein assembly factor BamB
MAGRIIHAAGGRIAVVAMLLLSGCWLQVGADAGHTRFNWVENGLNRENVDTLEVAWVRFLEGSQSEAIVSGGRVFVTNTDSGSEAASVMAFDAATGATVWERPLAARPPGAELVTVAAAPVAFVGDELWTGHSVIAWWWDGSEQCVFESDVLDPATGGRLSGTTGAPTSAAVSSGAVVARTLVNGQPDCSPPQERVLDVSRQQPDGSVVSWQSAIPVDTTRAEGPMLTGGQVVVIGEPETTVHSFAVDGCGAATCRATWTSTLDAPVGLISVPVAGSAGPIFVLAGQHLLALDRATGDELWRAPLGASGAGLALAEGTVYVTAGINDSQLQAFDADGCGAATCEPLWMASIGDQTGSDPVVGGGVVYVQAGSNLRAFDADGCGDVTCSPLVDILVLPSASLSLAGGRLFVSGGGIVAALEPATE